ncbi:unnamed protein product, partial [Closterium sp. NIES-65]
NGRPSNLPCQHPSLGATHVPSHQSQGAHQMAALAPPAAAPPPPLPLAHLVPALPLPLPHVPPPVPSSFPHSTAHGRPLNLPQQYLPVQSAHVRCHQPAGAHRVAVLPRSLPFPCALSQPMEDPSTFPNNIVLCGPPMFGAISPRALTEWLHFHRLLLPVDRFVLYDAGGVVDHADVSSAVQPWVRAGVVEVVGFEESTQYDVWSYAQALSTHDCLYGNRHGARWLLFADLDEFVEVLPPATLQQLLQDNAGRPWITFGCTVFNSSFCRPQEPWNGGATRRRRRMLLQGGGATGRRGKQGRGNKNFGHRKYILNPRRVSLAQAKFISHPYSRSPHAPPRPCPPRPIAPPRPPVCRAYPLTDPYVSKVNFYHLARHAPLAAPVCRASLAQIHVIIGGDMDGLDLPTDVARFAHYRGLTTRGTHVRPGCSQPLVALPRWVARMAQAARSCPSLVTAVPEVRRA